ncbi:MAG: helix-turn-helix domain containing protein [Planctomycetaceae bacterium]|nr:helix-turn-helix domain containing protein [Planctomycetaceae bacterium]
MMKKKDGKPKKTSPPRKENLIITQWTEPEKLELISCWGRDGYTDKEIAEKMGISISTLRSWRLKKPALDNAIRSSKEIVDYKVESALLRAALGYETKKMTVLVMKGKDGNMKVARETTTWEQPPNVLACQTWLFNRQRDKWKRNRDNEISVEDDRTINITITRAGQESE